MTFPRRSKGGATSSPTQRPSTPWVVNGELQTANRTNRHVTAALLAVVALTFTAVTACSQSGKQATPDPSSTTAVSQPPKSTSPYDETTTSETDEQPSATVPELDWTECNPGLECAEMPVPLDHADPDGEVITIALVRRPARNQSARIGSVVINPGGPGGSGIEAVSYLLFPPSVTERFDIVGFDPRGVGESTALDCRTHLQAIYDADPTIDEPADVDHLIDVSQKFVDECEANHGDQLPHMGTVNVAHDLDMIRAAVGDEQLTYVGYSYGTSIGQQYARLYPDRVRAMVLDGVVDVNRTGIEGAEGQAEGFTRAFDAYVANCDSQSCLPAPARSVIEQVIAAAEASPIPASAADRPATPGVVSLAMARAMYSQILWPQLTRALSDAIDGDATGLVDLADAYLQREPDGSYASGFEIYFAVSCLDAEWPADSDELLAAGVDVGSRYPLWGEALVNDYVRCSLWPVDPQPLEPIPADIEGLAPIVFISTTGDPATPYESGVRVAASVPGARLITNVGEGHTVFGNGKPCIDDTVAAYLVDLTVPEQDLRCE